MQFYPKSISEKAFSKEDAGMDRKNAAQYGDCGLGEKAIYVGAFGLPRMRYIPLKQVDRVFKRLAVSKGFFESGKVYGTIAYLVIKYDRRKETVYRFNNEDLLNEMLADIKNKTDIPVGKD